MVKINFSAMKVPSNRVLTPEEYAKLTISTLLTEPKGSKHCSYQDTDGRHVSYSHTEQVLKKDKMKQRLREKLATKGPPKGGAPEGHGTEFRSAAKKTAVCGSTK